MIGLPQLGQPWIGGRRRRGADVHPEKHEDKGRALRTIAESPDTASLLGVDVTRVVPVVFILTGLLAGVAGALFTVNYGDVSPFMGDHVGTKAIAAMVLGGIGSIWGAIAGGLLVGLTETLSIHFLGGDLCR